MERLSFAARMAQRVDALGSRLLVGIDPFEQRLPAEFRDLTAEEALTRFGHAVIDAVHEVAVAVKIQIAFFERHGWQGWRALQSVVEYAARQQLPVVMDAKRGDIGTTAAAYAEAFLGERVDTPGPFVDALTVNPYLGCDSLQPFVEHAAQYGKGLFVLARTSNPGGADFQEQQLGSSDGSGGQPLYLRVAQQVGALNEAYLDASGFGPVGLVAGATFPEQLAAIRQAAPHSWLLLPGIGAQGGKVEDLSVAFNGDGLGALPTASRSVIFAVPQASESWSDAIARSALEHRDWIQRVLPTR